MNASVCCFWIRVFRPKGKGEGWLRVVSQVICVLLMQQTEEEEEEGVEEEVEEEVGCDEAQLHFTYSITT